MCPAKTKKQNRSSCYVIENVTSRRCEVAYGRMIYVFPGPRVFESRRTLRRRRLNVICVTYHRRDGIFMRQYARRFHIFFTDQQRRKIDYSVLARFDIPNNGVPIVLGGLTKT